MCGRMTLTQSPREIAEFFDVSESQLELLNGHPIRPRYNVAPTQAVLTVVRNDAGPRAASWKTWGLVPSWAKDPSIGNKLFNARGETVDTKPSFRSAFKRRRCLVVADGFYEWSARNRGHQAHWFHPPNGGLLAFAGLHEHWSSSEGSEIESCTVITTDASSDMVGVHPRMPFILDRAVWEEWLDPSSDLGAVKTLVVPPPEGTLAVRPVSSRVNNSRNEDPRCLESAATMSVDDF